MARKRKSKKQAKSARSHQGSGFYKGRMTVTVDDRQKLQQKKDYRRKKLSQQRRQDLLTSFKRYLWYGVLFGLLVISYNLLQIKSYSFDGANLGEQQVAEINSLSDDYFGGLNRFKPAFDQDEYASYIKENTAFVAGLTVSSSPFSTNLDVSVVLKQPVFRYQRDGVPSNAAIAQDGTYLASDTTDLSATIIDATTISSAVGDQVVSPRQVTFFDQLSEAFELAGFQVVSYRITDEPREVTLRLEGQNYDVLISQDRSAVSVADDFQSVLSLVLQQGRAVSSYIDLRVADKAFYQ